MPQFIIIIFMLVGFILAKCEKTSSPKSAKTNHHNKENVLKIVEKDSLPKKDSTVEAVM